MICTAGVIIGTGTPTAGGGSGNGGGDDGPAIAAGGRRPPVWVLVCGVAVVILLLRVVFGFPLEVEVEGEEGLEEERLKKASMVALRIG